MNKRTWLAVSALVSATALTACAAQGMLPLFSDVQAAAGTELSELRTPEEVTAAPGQSPAPATNGSLVKAPASAEAPVSRARLSSRAPGDAQPPAPKVPSTHAKSTDPQGAAQQDEFASVRARLTQHLTERPFAGTTWDVAKADFSGYDASADLSWAIVHEAGPEASSYLVVLFHQGEPVQTTTAMPIAGVAEIARKAPDAISVTSWLAEDGQIKREWGAIMHQTFTWNSATGSATAAGEYWYDAALPVFGFHALSGWQPQPAPVAGAPAGAGGVIPAFAQPLTSDDPIGGAGLSMTSDAGTTVNCAVSFAVQTCVVPQADGTVLEVPLGDPYGGPRGQVQVGIDERDEIDQDVTGPLASNTLKNGQTVYFGSYVFVGQPAGMTAWNSVTGHGFVVQGSTVTQF